ncbi:MAG: sulfatase-like hydrolase/transferase [Oligoflexales bacterium]
MKIIIKAILTLLFLFSSWALLVYPNDLRISFRTFPTEKSGVFYKKNGRLFNKKNSLKITRREQPQNLSIDVAPAQNSIRYQSKHQTLLTTGLYPEKLESHDSFILLPNESATWITPPLTDTHKFYVSSPENIKITISNNNKTTILPIEKTPPSPNPWLHKNLWRYLYPDYDYTNWQLIEQNTAPGKTTITCHSTTEPCFISEPEFFTKTNTPPQNHIVLLIDTLRYDAVTQTKTPYTHNFFKHSAKYSHCLASSNMTSPSVNALLSCQHPEDIKDIAFAYGSPSSAHNSFYSRKEPSFPHILQNHNISTSMIGNISIISDSIGIGVNHGFQDLITIERDGYDTAKIIKESIKWIEQHKKESFFLYIHLHAPHGPYKAPIKDIVTTFQGNKDLSSSVNILKWLYRAELHYSDRYIKKLITHLRKTHLIDHTTLTLTSDHGDHHTPHSFTGNEAGPKIIGATFDHGGTLLNDEIRVPLYISTPPHNTGETVSSWTSNLGIGPYILNQYKIPTPHYCEYKNLNTQNEVIRFSGFKQKGFLFQGQYKYIRTLEADKRNFARPNSHMFKKENINIPEVIFDITKDKTENTPLHHGKTTSKLRNIYSQAFENKNLYTLHIRSTHESSLTIHSTTAPTNISSHATTIHQNPIHKTFCSKCTSMDVSFSEKPQISSFHNEKKIKTYNTSLHLPLKDNLFLEINPASPKMKGPSIAWLVYHEKQTTKSIQITAMNLKIERMLKQWGYLSESSP